MSIHDGSLIWLVNADCRLRVQQGLPTRTHLHSSLHLTWVSPSMAAGFLRPPRSNCSKRFRQKLWGFLWSWTSQCIISSTFHMLSNHLHQPRFKVSPLEVRSSADGSDLGYCLPHLYTGALTRLSREVTFTARWSFSPLYGSCFECMCLGVCKSWMSKRKSSWSQAFITQRLHSHCLETLSSEFLTLLCSKKTVLFHLL